MLTIRKATDRGYANHGWLNSYHTFSFAGYYDAKHMGVSALRVINDDTVAPGAGFGTHGHKDMEIISYVLSGALEHKDNMGNGSTIRPGEVQRMSAGTGVTHSEFNASDEETVNFLQIWIQPNELGIEPSYEQKVFNNEFKDGLQLVASPDAQKGSLKIHQDVYMYAGHVNAGYSNKYNLDNARKAYVHVANGDVDVNDVQLHKGDGLTLENETAINFYAKTKAEILLFDLP